MIDEPVATSDLTPAQFARVRSLFDRAADLPADGRSALLDRECPDDDGVRTAVLSLLRAGEEVGTRFNPDSGEIVRRLVEVRPSEGPPLERIGQYRIVRVLGEGGMGTVYLAEQSNPQREVALKVIRGGATSSSLRSRFGREVRALGRLEHPGIARIYEAGEAQTPAGPVAYFAMELVRGQRLADYARQHQLDIPARVELIAKVADAAQHAHTKGIIHRDLKPSNIVIAEEATRAGTAATAEPGTLTGYFGPQPKILDFGVARLHEPDTQHTAVTEAGLLIGTLAYMSPEQLQGDHDAVDARADVYALGVILFELLTGQPPHDLTGKSIPESARIVLEGEPRALRSPGTRAFDRDLQTIVQHALAKDRERRYATAAALADDLRRYLRNEPILARPATLRYQFVKFTRRHRGLVAGAAATVLALVAGLAVSIGLYASAEHQRVQAEQGRADAVAQRQIADDERARADAKERLSATLQEYFVERLLKAPAPDRMGEDVTMLEVLLVSRQDIHERFADQPEAEAHLRVELSGVLAEIGKLEESNSELVAAIPLLEQTVGPDHETTIQALCDHANRLVQLRRHEQAARVADEALVRAQRALPAEHPLYLRVLRLAGRIYEDKSYFGRAAKYYTEALAILERAFPNDTIGRMAIMNGLRVCDQGLKRFDEALVWKKRILDLVGSVRPEELESPQAQKFIMVMLKQADRHEEAADMAAALQTQVERTFSSGQGGIFYRDVAKTFLEAGRFEAAERAGLQADRALARMYTVPKDENRRAAAVLRDIYTAWGGHVEQAQRWNLELFKYTLMRPSVPLGALSRSLDEFEQALDALGLEVSRVQCLDLAWDARDQLAPLGHPQRAQFLASLASVSAAAGHQLHVQDAVDLARAALTTASNQAAVLKTLERIADTPVNP